MSTPRYSVGDALTFVNDYGAVFLGKTILSIDTAKWTNPEPRYFITPTDTPWFSVAEHNLKDAECADK